MATAQTEGTYHGEDNFVLELRRVKEKVRIKFLELKTCLTNRETRLIRELDDILSSYRHYKKEIGKKIEKERDIENIRNATIGVVTDSIVRTSHDDFLTGWTEDLEQLQIPVKPKLVNFVCNNNRLFEDLENFGKLEEKVSRRSYICKTHPRISACGIGIGNEQLNYPRDVTINNKTGYIYISDYFNNCVKVFNRNGKYVFRFGDGEGMDYPNSLSICDNTVLISQDDYSIMNYTIDGKFISKIGTYGSGELQFKYPQGLSIDEINGDVYICDLGNNRVQIITKEFQYKSQFGEDTLYQPLDVKLNKDNIFVLDAANPCLHIFNRQLVLQNSLISRGKGHQVNNPYFFYIDKFENILVSDRDSHSIQVFDPKFELISSISVHIYPMGITIDFEDRIIVVCQAINHCLQIFST